MEAHYDRLIEGCYVDELREVSGDVVASVGALVGQLSGSATPSPAELESIVASPATRLLVARDDGGIVLGILTLVLFRIPTGMRAWIEDVVVDDAARGRGVAQALTRTAVDIAQAEGARTVDLTSRPSRVAANRLYQKMGFVPRETNVYRFTASEE
jgi:ribosomal protein S18 acetylase RimI-like enzyme